MFAVIKTGGKQYRVAAQDMLKIDRLKAEPGEIVQFGEVLVVGGDNVTLGTPTIAGASVAAEVLQQGRGPKIIAFKKRLRKNSRRKRGFRPEFTLVRITEILTDGQAPTMTASVRRENPKPAPAENLADDDASPDDASPDDASPDEAAAVKAKAKKGKATKSAKKPAKAASSGKAKKSKSGGKTGKK
jgi:large subunit ribosomal protein L21